jgi:hypothetical protein
MDPISAAIIAAATAGVAGGVTAVGKQAIVDAYKGLKNWIAKKHGGDAKVVQAIAEVEAAPQSKARQMVLVEEMSNANIDKESEPQELASQLIAALKETQAGRAAVAKFQIDAKGAQVAVIGDHATIEGGIHFGEKKP